MTILSRFLLIVIIAGATQALLAQGTAARTAPSAAAVRGSQIAKAGFKNEDEISAKFNDWKADSDAQSWLRAMNYSLPELQSVSARKPHGEKADVELVIRTKRGSEKKEGISIKLVSSPNGFNQIDKRWLRQYVKLWSIPKNVESALKLFVGETAPTNSSRAADRMFLNELDPDAQRWDRLRPDRGRRHSRRRLDPCRV